VADKIRVVRHRRGIVEFWIPEGLEGSTLQLVRWPIQDETKLEYDEVLAARQQQFAGMFTIIGDGSIEEYKERYLVDLIKVTQQRLESGWVPERHEIHPWIKQINLTRWVTLEAVLDGKLPNYLAGFDRPEAPHAIGTGPVLMFGPEMAWALTTDGFYWLEAP
jgi:hypothetical protein